MDNEYYDNIGPNADLEDDKKNKEVRRRNIDLEIANEQQANQNAQMQQDKQYQDFLNEDMGYGLTRGNVAKALEIEDPTQVSTETIPDRVLQEVAAKHAADVQNMIAENQAYNQARNALPGMQAAYAEEEALLAASDPGTFVGNSMSGPVSDAQNVVNQYQMGVDQDKARQWSSYE